MNWRTKLKTDTAWAGHMDFATQFVQENNIQKVLELGTYGGHSLFSFAQGMKEGGELVAIDTWAGDNNMGAYTGDEIKKAIEDVIAQDFLHLKIRLIQKKFDDAKTLVKNKYFDLLHIDGSHDYANVSKDLANYIGKVKKGGWIMFHDTQVSQPGFDVGRLFGELQRDHPEWKFSERSESFGLGIVKLD